MENTKAVIKVKNEYLAPYTEWTDDINFAYVFGSKSEARDQISRARAGRWNPSVWKAARVVLVNITEAS